VAGTTDADAFEPIIGGGEHGDESIAGPTVTGDAEAELPKLVGRQGELDVPAVSRAGDIGGSRIGIGEWVEQEPIPITALAGTGEAEIEASGLDISKDAAEELGDLSGVSIAADPEGADMAGDFTDGSFKSPSAAKEEEVQVPETREKQFGEADHPSQGACEKNTENKGESPKPLPEAHSVQPTGVGKANPFEPDQEAPPHPGPLAGKQEEILRAGFGPEVGILTDEPAEQASGNHEAQQPVCHEPGPAKPQSHDAPVGAPAISPASPVSDTTTTSTAGALLLFRPPAGLSLHPASAFPAARRPHLSANPRAQTAGYLGLGLRGHRFVPVGLRGALGDVKARRLSLPPWRPDGTEMMEGLSATGRRPSVTQSEAGGSRLMVEGDDGGGGGEVVVVGDDGAQSGLPRMMVFLAGAVAIGTIMQRVAE
jgi:hypothetical protein